MVVIKQLKFNVDSDLAENFKAFAAKNGRVTYAEALRKLLDIAHGVPASMRPAGTPPNTKRNE
jgi:hypothetical protein